MFYNSAPSSKKQEVTQQRPQNMFYSSVSSSKKQEVTQQRPQNMFYSSVSSSEKPGKSAAVTPENVMFYSSANS